MSTYLLRIAGGKQDVPNALKCFRVGFFGKTENNRIVRGEKISRIHCTVQYNGKDLGFNVTDHSRNGVFVNGVRIPYNVPTYVSGKSIVALADGANKFQLIEAADEDDRSPALGADNEE